MSGGNRSDPEVKWSKESREPVGGAAVVDLQRVVEAVVEAGKRDAQRQLDDLRPR